MVRYVEIAHHELMKPLKERSRPDVTQLVALNVDYIRLDE